MKYNDCWYKGSCGQEPESCGAGCLRFLEMHHLLSSSNLPEDKWFPVPLYAEDDVEKYRMLSGIKKDIRSWVSSGKNLYLYSSNFGNGKTSWAIKLLLAYFNSVWAGNGFRTRGVFVSVPSFLVKNKEIISTPDPLFVEVRQNLLTCDLVIWDDIAATKLTDFDHSVLLSYVDARLLSKKSNIFTGNADGNTVIKYLGGRLASRVWNTSKVVEFVDEDKRGMY